MTDNDRRERINTQLIQAGTSKYSMRKNEVRHLYGIVHPDEQIGAAVNGRTSVGSVMLVATDRRVIFLDCKSFYTTVDELSYDVVSGVSKHVQGLFASVVLHTRVGEYSLRFVNTNQAKKFVEYIEAKRLENYDLRTVPQVVKVSKIKNEPTVSLKKKEKLFLATHNVGVLSTIDRSGNVHGAVIYYVFDNDSVYFLTKSETAKARNILVHNQVALTVFEELSYRILQLRGAAEVVNELGIRNQVFDLILKNRNLEDGKTLPPVTKIVDGGYVVFKVHLTEAKYSEYK